MSLVGRLGGRGSGQGVASWVVVLALVLGLGLGLGGCATSVPVDDENGATTRLRPPPAGTTASRVLVSSTVPVDTVGNGHGDRFTVVVYLFGPMDRYPLPFWETGSFEFVLRDARSGETMMSWSVAAEEARGSRQLLQPGPAYMFDLSLIEAGGMGADVFPVKPVELIARFRSESAGSGQVVEGRPHPIRLGGTGEVRGSGVRGTPR